MKLPIANANSTLKVQLFQQCSIFANGAFLSLTCTKVTIFFPASLKKSYFSHFFQHFFFLLISHLLTNFNRSFLFSWGTKLFDWFIKNKLCPFKPFYLKICLKIADGDHYHGNGKKFLRKVFFLFSIPFH